MNSDPHIIVLTSPAGSGKNTIAAAYAALADRCAIVDVDTVRQMLVKPHLASWEGDEGAAQHKLGIYNACSLANTFLTNGYNVLILDVIPEEFIPLYREYLKASPALIVLVLPSLDEVLKRNAERITFITKEEIALLYQSQQELISFDKKIDNTRLSPEEVAEQLMMFHQ